MSQPSSQLRAGSVVARVAGGVLLLAAALYVMQPFLVPVLWAGILAYASWPAYRWVRARTRRPRLSAALFTLAIALGVGIPVAWLIVALAREGTTGIGAIRAWIDAGMPFPEWVESRPWLAERLGELRGGTVIEPRAVVEYAARYASGISGRLVDVAGSLASNLFRFTITVVTLFVFYVDGERVAEHARRFAAVVFPQTTGFLEHVGAVVRAVVFGLIGTALVQGVLAGIGFQIFGVPSPVALGAITFVGSFVPAGPMLIWIGAAIWLYLHGATGAAVGMSLYGLLLISSVDNVLRPMLISGSGGARVPFLLVFFGVIGGLAAFGMLGLFVGPVVLSVTFALAAEFARRGEVPPAPAVEP
jgi:predicted PurR-regulated permease PerM